MKPNVGQARLIGSFLCNFGWDQSGAKPKVKYIRGRWRDAPTSEAFQITSAGCVWESNERRGELGDWAFNTDQEIRLWGEEYNMESLMWPFLRCPFLLKHTQKKESDIIKNQVKFKFMGAVVASAAGLGIRSICGHPGVQEDEEEEEAVCVCVCVRST